MPPMRSSQMQTNNSRVKMESPLTHGNSNNNDNSNNNSNNMENCISCSYVHSHYPDRISTSKEDDLHVCVCSDSL